MIKTAVDTCILFDLFLTPSDFTEKSKTLLEKADQDGPLIICELVLSELSSEFKKISDLTHILKDMGIIIVPSSIETLYLAGQNYQLYRDQKPKVIQCAFCGHVQKISCSSCHKKISARQHIMADFIIGAHAVNQANRLLTRDRGFYRKYFSGLKIME